MFTIQSAPAFSRESSTCSIPALPSIMSSQTNQGVNSIVFKTSQILITYNQQFGKIKLHQTGEKRWIAVSLRSFKVMMAFFKTDDAGENFQYMKLHELAGYAIEMYKAAGYVSILFKAKMYDYKLCLSPKVLHELSVNSRIIDINIEKILSRPIKIGKADKEERETITMKRKRNDINMTSTGQQKRCKLENRLNNKLQTPNKIIKGNRRIIINPVKSIPIKTTEMNNNNNVNGSSASQLQVKAVNNTSSDCSQKKKSSPDTMKNPKIVDNKGDVKKIQKTGINESSSGAIPKTVNSSEIADEGINNPVLGLNFSNNWDNVFDYVKNDFTVVENDSNLQK